jgi:hypothetical protein
VATDRPFFKVQHWLFGLHFRTVRRDLADCPPRPRGPSAPGIADCLSPLLFELRFRVALSLGLFLGLVGSL